MGRHLCPCCDEPLEEDRSFWEALKNSFFGVINAFYQQLRFYNVAYQGISAAMKLVFPRGKTMIYNEFMESVEKTYIPPVEDVLIVHYDEQHLKINGTKEFSPNIA